MIFMVHGRKVKQKRIVRTCPQCGHAWYEKKKKRRDFYKWKYSRTYSRCPNCRAFIKILKDGEKTRRGK